VTTIIFLWESAFTERDATRMGISTLLSRGFRVEVWNLSAVLHGNAAPVLPPAAGTSPRTRMFSERKEVEDAIRTLDRSTVVNCFIGFSFRTRFIFRALSRSQARYAVQSFNALPEVSLGRSGEPGLLASRLVRHLRASGGRRILEILMDSVLRKHYRAWGIRPADILLAGGVAPVPSSPYPVGDTTRILWLHALDYDHYLALRDRPFRSEPDMAVFIDGYDFHHPDLTRCGEGTYPWEAAYFSRLRQFFDTLERAWGMRVVIAAHPLARYERPIELFGERPVIQGRTAELIQQGGLTLLHASTAVNYAVLFRKPVLFLTDENYRSHVLGPYIESMAAKLHRPLVSLDRPPARERQEVMQVDGRRYQEYQNRYIKKEGSDDHPFWEIFADAIEAVEDSPPSGK